jgi:2-acylglycerol O-acyltransferase 2
LRHARALHSTDASLRRGQWLSVPTSCDASADAVDAAILAALPGDMRGAVATCLLHLPLLRHLMAWAGMVPANRDVIAALLRAGTSVVIIPGGIAEIFVSRTDDEVLVLRQRKGFARAALAAGGLPIVPIYCFGNTGVFHVAPPPAPVAALSRRARVGLLAFWGRWGLPLPYRHKLLVVVGRPVRPAPGEDADALHARYCEELTRLFDEHKGRLGPDWAAKTLRIT